MLSLTLGAAEHPEQDSVRQFTEFDSDTALKVLIHRCGTIAEIDEMIGCLFFWLESAGTCDTVADVNALIEKEHRACLKDIGSYRRVLRVITHIDTHLDHKLELAELSKIAELSPYYFARLFKGHTGLSPHQYVMKRRIEAAKELLEGTSLPLSAIAYDLGFASQAHFTFVFHEVQGITPWVYRTVCKKQSIRSIHLPHGEFESGDSTSDQKRAV